MRNNRHILKCTLLEDRGRHGKGGKAYTYLSDAYRVNLRAVSAWHPLNPAMICDKRGKYLNKEPEEFTMIYPQREVIRIKCAVFDDLMAKSIK